MTAPAKSDPTGRPWLAFALVAGILAVAAAGLNASVRGMRLHFQKLPVPLAAPLDDPAAGLPRTLGPWVALTDDKPLPADVAASLGTDQYVFRVYGDSRRIPAEVMAIRQSQPDAFLRGAQAALAGQNDAVVHIAITYYTGLVDTVPHIPDRCYVADGFLPATYQQRDWTVDGTRVPVRFIHFEDQTGSGRVTRTVAYFFQVNGVLEADPLAVRARLQNLLQRYGYFAKIELMTQVIEPEKSAAVMQEFLAAALPELQKRLPDFSQYGGGAAATP